MEPGPSGQWVLVCTQCWHCFLSALLPPACEVVWLLIVVVGPWAHFSTSVWVLLLLLLLLVGPRLLATLSPSATSLPGSKPFPLGPQVLQASPAAKLMLPGWC
jgi:hypothetical protein